VQFAYSSDAGAISAQNPPAVTQTMATGEPSGPMVRKTVYDGLGRTIQQTAPNGAIVDTTYDGLGHIHTVSNPHFTSSSPSDGTTTFAYDALGRKIVQTQPDGSLHQWCYNGVLSGQSSFVCSPNASSKTADTWVDDSDETNRHYQRVSDALGRLSAVMEPVNNLPALETDYSYDALGDLLGVNQKGAAGETPRIRSFVYDSLSRLTSSTNPETGTIGYSYDANGNMMSKTDARGISTGYVYDALNRMTQKSSAGGNGVPGFNYNYGYDSVNPAEPNGIGRLLFTTNNTNQAEQYFYDAVGRMTAQTSYLPSATSTPETVSASYDLAGNITSLTYPDGRVVNQTWDGGGHLIQISDGTDYQYLTNSSTYWPNGAPQGIRYGNGVANGHELNNRLQVIGSGATRLASPSNGSFSTQYVLSARQSCFGPFVAFVAPTLPGCPAIPSGAAGAGNNGNIWQITDALNSANTQGFTYDSLNRLTSFTRGGTSIQTFQYPDSFGNMIQSGNLSSGLSFATNNRINSLNYGYDAAGNLTQSYNGLSITPYTYDAESKLVSVNNAAYTYDANGDRARKDVSPNWTEYVRFNGQVLAEKNSDGTWSDYIFANGQRIARADNYDVRIHMSGTNCSGCGSTNTFAGTFSLGAANGYTIQKGDLLTWRQYQDGVGSGGIDIFFASDNSTANGTLDSGGQPIEADTKSNQWDLRVVDLSGVAGKKISNFTLWNNTNGSPGNWDIYFGDIVLVRTDGTSIPIYSRTLTSLSSFQGAGVTSLNVVTEKTPNGSPEQPSDYLNSTTYYSDDQIGSTQMLTDAAGWPVSSSSYYPFGAEITPSAGNNHYKFTGKERDAESGLDDFGARYYSSNMGRWMSPDWADKPEAVPYSDLSNPQSLNLYGYVNNNPISKVDADGHFFEGGPYNSLAGQAEHAFLLGQDPTTAMHNWAQQQGSSSSSNGNSVWSHVSNLLHGHSWNYSSPVFSVNSRIEVPESEPLGSVTVGTDIGSIAGVLAGESLPKLMGPMNAALSVFNDPKPLNKATNLLGLLPGFEVPMAITAPFNDFLDYGINNSNPGPQKFYNNDQLAPQFQGGEPECAAAGGCN
jgi:RHS repeat-associated protein